MYITNHRIYDPREMKKLSIGIRYTDKDYGANTHEEYFCAADAPKVAACATVERLGGSRATLTELVVRDEYRGMGVEAGLIQYILFELRSEGMSDLALGLADLDRQAEAFSWIESLQLEEGSGATIIKGLRRTQDQTPGRAI